MSGNSEPVVRLDGAQIGEQHIGTAAQPVTTNHSGIAAGEAFGFIKEYLWLDDQRREQRQHEFDLFQKMTAQRLDVIADGVAHTRLWLIFLTVAVVILSFVVMAVVYDRLAVVAGLALGTLLAARSR